MKAKYLCPKCRNSVNIGDDILLTAKTNTGLKGILILKSEFGNYSARFSDDFNIVDGNKLKLSCPICRGKLATRKNNNLAHLLMMDEKSNEVSIYFSQVYGEKCTYRIEGKQLTMSLRNDKHKYVPDWLIK